MLTEAHHTLNALRPSAGESVALLLAVAAVLTELAVRCNFLAERAGAQSWGLSTLHNLYRCLKIEGKQNEMIDKTRRLKAGRTGESKWMKSEHWRKTWDRALPSLGARAPRFCSMVNRVLLATLLAHYE